MNTTILLCTLNSTYQHSSFGLRYLFANLEDLQAQCEILEFTIAQNAKDIAEKVLQKNPKIVGFGVYIWNIQETLRVVRLLKSVAPEIKIVLGGPEVSHETETQKIVQLADHTIKGEADFLFLELCRNLLANKQDVPKIISATLPDIKKIKSPYSYYTDADIKNRIIYVEASRGCPYKCEYCLSSLDKSVRNFDLNLFLQDLQQLIDKGTRQFKFVDRTFNLSPTTSCQILQFFLDRIDLGLFLHFEMVPDRLPEELKSLIEKFPAGSLQFEIGIQTFNPVVAANVSRRQDYKKIHENFIYLKEKTQVHTHADLIVGLPGETQESFARGFDTLVELAPDEIQIGILKRLKGFPLARHDQSFKMVYDDFPPYQILQNKDLNFTDLQGFHRFAKTWDQVANSGNFPHLMKFWKTQIQDSRKSFFSEVSLLSSFLQTRHGQTHGVSLLNLLESLWVYFQKISLARPAVLAEILALDYAYKKRRDLPHFLKNHLSHEILDHIKISNLPSHKANNENRTPERQHKHLIETH